MKRLILFVLLFAYTLLAGEFQPKVYGWKQVYNYVTVASTDTAWSLPYEASVSNGVKVFYLDLDNNNSIGEITVVFQIYNEVTGKWANYYTGNEIATIDPNTAQFPVYLVLPKIEKFAWGSKHRVGLISASGSGVVIGYVGGQ